MRPLREQVDEFIEGYFDGSIISAYTTERFDKGVSLAHSSLSDPRLQEEEAHLTTKLIPHYIALVTGDPKLPKVPEQDLVDCAFNVFQQVLKLRSLGILLNSPDTLKETTYWKNRCLTVELESAQKDEKIRSLVENIDKLRVGRSGIK